MYLRTIHAEEDREVLFDLIGQHPLGLITTFIDPCKTGDFPCLQSTHIPWTLDREGGQWGNGVLRAHMARANPHAKQLVHVQRQATSGNGHSNNVVLSEDRLSVTFTHTTHSYVSPRFYTSTKPKTGKVVPTWNYAAVEVRGALRLYDSSTDWLDQQIEQLTRSNEPASLLNLENDDNEQKHAGWNVSDAPSCYIQALKKAIIGIEIDIYTIVGKFKMSQESTQEDRLGVIAGFNEYQTQEGHRMAQLVEQCGEKSAQKRWEHDQVNTPTALKGKSSQFTIQGS